MSNEHKGNLLALYPIPRGYAFVLFENGLSPVDWGVRDIRCKAEERNAKSLTDVEALVDQCRPTMIVMEDSTEPESRRAPRIKKLSRSIAHLADKRTIPARLITKHHVLAVFAPSGATTRYAIAQEVAKQFPSLGCRLPRQRHIWESEPPVMGLFAAAALGLAFHAGQRTKVTGEGGIRQDGRNRPVAGA